MTNLLPAVLAILTGVTTSLGLPAEADIVLRAALAYDLDSERTLLLAAVRRVENGRPSAEYGCETPAARRYAGDARRSTELQARWAAGTIKRRYTGDVDAFARRYCPPNWRWWAATVAEKMVIGGHKFGVTK